MRYKENYEAVLQTDITFVHLSIRENLGGIGLYYTSDKVGR